MRAGERRAHLVERPRILEVGDPRQAPVLPGIEATAKVIDILVAQFAQRAGGEQRADFVAGSALDADVLEPANDLGPKPLRRSDPSCSAAF